MQTEESEDEGGLHIDYKMTVKEDEPLIEEVAVEKQQNTSAIRPSPSSPDASTKEIITVDNSREKHQTKNFRTSSR